jgi:hypothetical protein
MKYKECEKCQSLVPGFMGYRCLYHRDYIDCVEKCNQWILEEKSILNDIEDIEDPDDIIEES